MYVLVALGIIGGQYSYTRPRWASLLVLTQACRVLLLDSMSPIESKESKSVQNVLSIGVNR